MRFYGPAGGPDPRAEAARAFRSKLARAAIAEREAVEARLAERHPGGGHDLRAPFFGAGARVVNAMLQQQKLNDQLQSMADDGASFDQLLAAAAGQPFNVKVRVSIRFEE